MTTIVDVTVPPPKGRRRRKAVPALIAGGVMLLFMLVVSFLLPTPHPPNFSEAAGALVPPSAHHLLGTDELGRDVLSRLIAGGRTDVPLAFLGMLLSLVIGLPVGLAASSRGRMAEVLMRLLDLLQAFPLLIISVLFVALAGNHRYTVVVAIVFVGAPQTIRIIRAEALLVRRRRFVEASAAIGARPSRVLWTHVVPNLLPTLVAQASLIVGQGLLVISALTFLGFGVQPPTASWGAMVREGLTPIQGGQWWICIFPGIAIFLTILATNLLADGIRETAGA